METLNWLMKSDSVLFWITILLSLIILAVSFYTVKLKDVLQDILNKETDTQIILEFISRSLMRLGIISIEDIYDLETNLSDNSNIIRTIIKEKLSSNKYKNIIRNHINTTELCNDIGLLKEKNYDNTLKDMFGEKNKEIRVNQQPKEQLFNKYESIEKILKKLDNLNNDDLREFINLLLLRKKINQ